MRTNRLIRILPWIFILYALLFSQTRIGEVVQCEFGKINDWLCPNAYAADKGAAPVAHWRFDEGGGPTAYDESTNNNDGTLQPAVRLETTRWVAR